MNGAADVATEYEPLPWSDSGDLVEDRGAGAPRPMGHSARLRRQCRPSGFKCGYGLQLSHGAAPLCTWMQECIDGKWLAVGHSAK